MSNSDDPRLTAAIADYRELRRRAGVEVSEAEARRVVLLVLDTFLRRYDREKESQP